MTRNLPDNPAVFGFTLGCRLNSYETDAMVDQTISALGGRRVEDPCEADVIIVNTCTVTGRSQARSRKTVRTYRTRYPAALIAITGCAAQMEPDDFACEESDRVLVFSNSDKHLIPSILASKPVSNGPQEGLFPGQAPKETSRTRAFLKIQDGCSNRCTYCIVPLARGESRSQPRETVLEQAAQLSGNGYREICLTGVDIADYGRDLYRGYGLAELVHDLLNKGGFRLRIGSVEPNRLTVETLRKLAVPGVCRHFHIPFQSGSDRILALMGRNYGRAQEEELLQAIDELFPGACIGCDIIAGFPGETHNDHCLSMSLAGDPRVSYLHVFPFSPRPGTPAAKMDQLHTETVTARAVELRKASKLARTAFRNRMKGTLQSVLVEGRKHMGRHIGLTGNYIPVYAPDKASEGQVVEVFLDAENTCMELR